MSKVSFPKLLSLSLILGALFSASAGAAPTSQIQFDVGGVKIHSDFFAADCGTTRAQILFLPGLASNSLWYHAHAKALAAKCFSVLLVDRRGTGRSGGARGDIDNFDDLLSDIQAPLDHLHAASNKPVILMTMSYAWKLPILFVQKFPDYKSKIDSFVVLSPTTDLQKKYQPSTGYGLDVLFSYETTLLASPIPPEAVTDDPKMLAWIKTPGNAQTQFTSRFLWRSKGKDKEALKLIANTEVKMLTVLTKKDRLVDNAQVKPRFAAATPNKALRQVVEVDADHILQSVEGMKSFAQLIEDWTKR